MDGVTWDYIVFGVNSNEVNRYDLQFYKTAQTDDDDYAAWVSGEGEDGVMDYVECIFTQTDSAAGEGGGE